MKLFLFDFDGVLVDSLEVYEKTVKDCLKDIKQPLIKTREEFLELFDDNFYESLKNKGINLDEFMKSAEDILKQVKIRDMKPFAGVAQVIEELHKKHCLVVVSSNDYASIKEALDLFHYDGYFRDILGSDFMFSKKEKILYAAKKYNVDLNDIYYIGDTTGDIKEGKQAGVKTVGVTWGWHSKEKMAAVQPDYLFDHPKDLLRLNQV
ncbi:MAG: HAD family hydrolase [Smithella sp.]|nr:HAD family hydrolase [Smithella sp.]